MVINAKQQREALNQTGLEMIRLCASQIEKALEAYMDTDCDLAEEVLYKENRVNALDLKIEKDCERFIALYNPVASDLRFIMSLRKINLDLERIGDHSYSIAKYVVERDAKPSLKLFQKLSFKKMIETLFFMIENITTAYENKDVKVARKVFKKDKILDKINETSFIIIEDEIKKDNEIVRDALILFSIIKKVERIGDLIKNISEEIIFYIDAENVKHMKKK